jgi:NADH oxidase (H2O2-forming)
VSQASIAGSFGRTFASYKGKDEPEIIERAQPTRYLRILLEDGKVRGGQAIGEFADWINLFMGAMARNEDFNILRSEWSKIAAISSPYPWQFRKMGQLIGLSVLAVPTLYDWTLTAGR